ncbi:MAG: FkbM family methyltransferase [Proteobacteria bacterium]|nr:FkbM family methyltransferase [Pseudomonadota bacterium]
MRNPDRKLAFVLAATEQGSLIVNRLDFHSTEQNATYGVGHQLLEKASFDVEEVELALQLLELRRRYFGDGVVAVDCGANIGVHALSWARLMTGWGSVFAIEAQERIFYALAGNIALSNCFNISARHAAVTAEEGEIRIPMPDYRVPASFGSLELRKHARTEFIGQDVDYAEGSLTPVRAMTIDGLCLGRLDFLKIDVEGMEIEALKGGRATIAAQRPVILAEHIKADKERLAAELSGHGYAVHLQGMNLLAIHPTDKVTSHIRAPAT